MTNHNKKLDEMLSGFRQSSIIINASNSLGAGEKGREAFIQSIDEAKQAITSLTKELVAEARIDELENNKWLPNEAKWIEQEADRIAELKAQQEEV